MDGLVYVAGGFTGHSNTFAPSATTTRRRFGVRRHVASVRRHSCLHQPLQCVAAGGCALVVAWLGCFTVLENPF
ncbi:unnamed protein product [Gadus morhua 'NCC']